LATQLRGQLACSYPGAALLKGPADLEPATRPYHGRLEPQRCSLGV